MTALVVVAVGALLAWPRRPPGRRPTIASSPAVPTAVTRRWIRPALAVGAAVIDPVLGLVVVTGLAAWPRLAARAAVRRRRRAVADAVPEVADLLALSAAGGLTVPPAVAVAAGWSPVAVAPSLRRAAEEVALGRPVADALGEVADDLGPPARPVVDALVASVRYGAPLVDALDRVAREARLDRRRRAEERARRVPVLMLFPLVLCILPAFALLTVVPLLVGSLPELPP